ncbi:hypothetical protein [Chryseobacterium sp. c4a]|uniref:hypothetical protein n=1 Tax=Chryseobacterium sp. c4a TaxID=1573582 RepID=UPI0013595DAE|nr:hypothetical protein [Chryseobacterium sp. c4a]
MENLLIKSNLIVLIFIFSSFYSQEKKLDSITINNGKYYIYVQEKNDTINRSIEVYKNKNILLSTNKNIIPCRNCGGINGDPYISIEQGENSEFVINMDNNLITFSISNNRVLLVQSKFFNKVENKKSRGKVIVKYIIFSPRNKQYIYLEDYSQEKLERQYQKKVYFN